MPQSLNPHFARACSQGRHTVVGRRSRWRTSAVSVCSFFAFFAFVFSAPLLGSCTTSSDASSASVPESALEDEAYAGPYKNWHTKVSVVDQFQKKFDAEAVLLSNDMRRAYTERWSRLRGKSDAGLGDLSGGKLAVILSYFSPQDEYMDLSNPQLWTVELSVAGKNYAPALVQKLPQKAALEPFFPFVNQWTVEYLLVFDASSDASGEQGMVIAKSSAQLKLKSALVNATLGW